MPLVSESQLTQEAPFPLSAQNNPANDVIQKSRLGWRLPHLKFTESVFLLFVKI